MSEQTLIIAGASLAGAKAAEELRTQGFDGRVLLIGAERERLTSARPLTKDYLRARAGADLLPPDDRCGGAQRPRHAARVAGRGICAKQLRAASSMAPK